MKRLLITLLAAAGLSGCVAYGPYYDPYTGSYYSYGPYSYPYSYYPYSYPYPYSYYPCYPYAYGYYPYYGYYGYPYFGLGLGFSYFSVHGGHGHGFHGGHGHQH